jgi:hypothetical protein
MVRFSSVRLTGHTEEDATSDQQVREIERHLQGGGGLGVADKAVEQVANGILL